MTACLLAGMAVLAYYCLRVIPDAWHFVRYGTERPTR
jgi:hypothetical protein